MDFEICFVRSADDDLAFYRTFERRVIIAAIERLLSREADVETRRRKRLRPNPLAPWELRIGEYRIFYEIEAGKRVRVLAIGHKRHNELFVRGRKVML